ncbi:MAG: efflux RND transporter periplasmic adaptor subunit [Bacteroidetes bacterium]|nr:efflux RND transporter periplasmic adaptor subunit [Bacteroidota bacterium]
MNLKYSFLLLVSILWISCNSKQEKIKPTKSNITESVYASGFVKSKNQYQVFAKTNGTIKSFKVQKGDFIHTGDIIAYISNETSLLNAENAELTANNADLSANTDKLREANLSIQLAKKKMLSDSLTYYRQKKLWAEEIGTKNELEQRELAYENSKSMYSSAWLRYNDVMKQLSFADKQSKKSVSIAKSMLSDFTIRSQVTGKVYSLLKEAGEMVNTQTPIAIIGDANSFYLKLQVDENDILKIKQNQKVLLTLDSYKGEVFEAIISQIDPMMNERSRTFEVEATFTKQPNQLYPNLTIEANILLQSKQNVLTIPRDYLIDDSYVMISKKEKKKIKIGLIDYQKVEVLEGLTENDEIYKPTK